jgi:hypothetical protein
VGKCVCSVKGVCIETTHFVGTTMPGSHLGATLVHRPGGLSMYGTQIWAHSGYIVTDDS